MAMDMLFLNASILTCGYFILLYFLGYEKADHNKRLHSIPLRIHVNGIRGKSSVTRLVGSILRISGYNAFTKTTGSSARLIYPNGKDERIERKNANIQEQVTVVKKISKYEPNALVIECMAIDPRLQKISENHMVQANIGVITNVRMDHQDKMGRTLEKIAASLCEFMPTNGHLVCGEQNPKLIKLIKKRAKKRNTKVLVVKSKLTKKDREQLKNFDYIEHEENVTLSLGVARILNIDKSVAFKGMIKNVPDPGVLRIYKKKVKNKQIKFVNAHAANDRESVLIIYNTLKKRGLLEKDTKKIAVLYNRKDRHERVDIFADIVTKELKFDEIILLGHYKDRARKRIIQSGFSEKNVHELKKENLKNLLNLFHRLAGKETVIMGMVNIHGNLVEKYINYFHTTNGNGRLVL